MWNLSKGIANWENHCHIKLQKRHIWLLLEYWEIWILQGYIKNSSSSNFAGPCNRIKVSVNTAFGYNISPKASGKWSIKWHSSSLHIKTPTYQKIVVRVAGGRKGMKREKEWDIIAKSSDKVDFRKDLIQGLDDVSKMSLSLHSLLPCCSSQAGAPSCLLASWKIKEAQWLQLCE